MKKRYFHDHPLLGGVIAMLLAYAACYIISLPATKLLASFGPQTEEFRTTAAMIGQVITIVCALVCLFVFCRLNRVNGYRGLRKIQGVRLRGVWVCIGLFVGLDLAVLLCIPLLHPDLASKIPAPTLSTVVLAIYAGINEEVTDRAVPLAVMMRNKPTTRRIRLSVLLTTLIFSLTHFVNILQGQSVAETVMQAIFSAGMGLFFAAIYLRTGSILLTIVLHILHDFLASFTGAITSEDLSPILVMLSLTSQYLPFVLGFVMLRKKRHQDIISTWARIWPEGSDPQP